MLGIGNYSSPREELSTQSWSLLWYLTVTFTTENILFHISRTDELVLQINPAIH